MGCGNALRVQAVLSMGTDHRHGTDEGRGIGSAARELDTVRRRVPRAAVRGRAAAQERSREVKKMIEWSVTCLCGEVATTVFPNRFSAEQEFKRDGWQIAKRASLHDRCPDCSSAMKEAR